MTCRWTAAGLSARDSGGRCAILAVVYHARHYGAFVRDRDGNDVEAVCHRASEGD